MSNLLTVADVRPKSETNLPVIVLVWLNLSYNIAFTKEEKIEGKKLLTPILRSLFE